MITQSGYRYGGYMEHEKNLPGFVGPLLTPARYVTVRLASQLTGYSESAIYTKISTGVWEELKVWRRAPDGRVLVDLQGYLKWAEGRPTPGGWPSRHRRYGH